MAEPGFFKLIAFWKYTPDAKNAQLSALISECGSPRDLSQFGGHQAMGL
jgi:hypothetical protein